MFVMTRQKNVLRVLTENKLIITVGKRRREVDKVYPEQFPFQINSLRTKNIQPVVHLHTRKHRYKYKYM